MNGSLKKWTVGAAVVCSLLSAIPGRASATAAYVRASIPTFPLQINGQALDQPHSKYPFLFYKDITYLPMTWNNLQALGIEYEWSDEEGLRIWSNRNVPPPIHESPIEQDLSDNLNPSGSLFAGLTDEPIAINQTVIDNKTETYPFLTYRDVTYMPLTWRFVHDLLQLDIRWSDEDGLQLIGSQNAFGPIIGDDEQSLYFYSMLAADPAKSMIKMDKTSYSLEWEGREERDRFLKELSEAKRPFGGEPAHLTRKDRDLYYGDTKIYTFTDEDLWESADVGGPVHTYTEFKAGDRTTVFTINLRLPLPVIGPNYGITHTILVRDGKATELKDLNERLDRVIPNPDGTVWIAASRLPGRFEYMPYSARLALLDNDGNVHVVNDLLNEADVLALGLTNPALANPAAADGSLYVVLFGHKKSDFSTQETAGLYTLSTKLELTHRSGYDGGEYYLDNHRSIYVQKHNNTIVNETTGEFRNWFDYDLARMK